MKLLNTGASNTKTFNVQFSLAYQEDNWGVCPTVAYEN